MVVLGAVVCSGCTALPKTSDPAAPTSAAAGDTTIVAIAPPQTPHASIWDLLGVNQIAGVVGHGVHSVQNCLGMRFPGLEPTPPLLPISDPANLSSGTPAVSAAAEVKAQEDAAPQKIKALRYLAGIGCGGCYANVEDALLSALDDCTEAVRYEAVMALRNTATQACNFCSETACCSFKVQEKLHKIAYEMDESGCYLELSDRVRRQARLAYNQCPAASAPEQIERGEGPSEEGPLPTPADPGTTQVPAPDDTYFVPRPRNHTLSFGGGLLLNERLPPLAPPVQLEGQSGQQTILPALRLVMEQPASRKWEVRPGGPAQ